MNSSGMKMSIRFRLWCFSHHRVLILLTAWLMGAGVFFFCADLGHVYHWELAGLIVGFSVISLVCILMIGE